MRPEDRRHVIKMMAQELQEEFEAAIAEEREACAKDMLLRVPGPLGEELAAAIRARA